MVRVFGDRRLGQASGGDPSAADGSGLLTPDEQVALIRAPKRAGWWDAVGKAWNAPNTVIGAIYGGQGMGVGEMARAFDPAKPKPDVFWRDNALQFTNNPFGGVSAITLGNTTTWIGDPYDPKDPTWHDNGVPRREPSGDPNGHIIPQHETAHTYQGQQLGPLYLPSNLLGGLNALMHGEDWHGDHNWNEVGPQSPPATPWPTKRR